jgi:hypothetical protein
MSSFNKKSDERSLAWHCCGYVFFSYQIIENVAFGQNKTEIIQRSQGSVIQQKEK